MDNLVKRIVKDQSGQLLIIVMIVLLVGGLTIVPTLSFMSTGIKAGQKTETRTNELYAADAGAQSALWWLKKTPYYLLPVTPSTYIEFPPSGVLTCNGEKVFAFVEYVDTVDELRRYRITSVAGPDVIHDTNLDNQPAAYTKIISFVSSVSCDLTGIMSNVITSRGDITVLGGQASVSPPAEEEHGAESYYDGIWPTAEQLYQFYWQQVMTATPYSSNSVDVSNTPSIGPFYRNGALTIENSGAAGATMTLDGPLFINGDTEIGATGHDFNLELNGQTIYINSNTYGLPYALQIGSKCTISGSGAIIALGDIEFKPGISSGPSNYLFVMSVLGMTYLQPGGDFYGTVAGSTTVDVQNGTIIWVDPTGTDLNVPGVGSGTFWGIKTWDITLDS
jgi:hypothetical protein